jgi:enoyl-CoA hydratase/carnithine racemase
MRSDRGYFCFPEADLKIPLLPGMLGLLKKAIPLQIMEEMLYTGIRLTADQCVDHRIVKEACHQDNLIEKTMRFAKSLNKNRMYIKEMRHRLYKDILFALDVEDVSYIESGRLTVG